MGRALAFLAAVLAGGLVALQAPINSALGRATGTLFAAALSFSTGALVLLTLVAVSGGFSGFGRLGGLPWWAYVGGVLGAVYVSTALVAVRPLGVGGITAATITGQLTAAVLVDRFGWLGVEERGLTAGRLAGLALLALGTVLVVRS